MDRAKLSREMTHQPPPPPMSDAARAAWAMMMTPYKLAYDIGSDVVSLPERTDALRRRLAGEMQGPHYDESGQPVVAQPTGGGLMEALMLGLDTGVGSMAASAATGTGANAAGMFVGPRALGSGGERARAAQRLTAESGQQGAGWARHKAWVAPTDDIARAEIADPEFVPGEPGALGRVFRPDLLRNEGGLTLSDVLEHPRLFEEYPDMMDLPVDRLRGLPAAYTAVYNTPMSGRLTSLDDGREVPEAIAVNLDKAGPMADRRAYRSLLHEVQHGVQTRENMAMGGNEALASRFIYPEGAWEPYQEARSSLIKTIGTSPLVQAIKAAGGDASKLIDMVDDPGALYRAAKAYTGDEKLAEALAREADRLMGLRPGEPTMPPYEAYKRLAGETEARATAARAGWDLERRFQEPPMIRPGREGYFDYGYSEQFPLLPPEGVDPFKDVYGIMDYLERNGGR